MLERLAPRDDPGTNRARTVHISSGKEGNHGKEIMTDGNEARAARAPCGSVFSAFISAIASGDLNAAETKLSDGIEWHQMPYGRKLTGKREVMPWLKAGAASQKEPEIINDVAANDWGVFEYWNIGTVTPELIEFGKSQGWPFPKDPNSLVRQKYKVAQCFVYHLDVQGKIDMMRQYLDTGSVWAQFK